jgi:hypothetical protein
VVNANQVIINSLLSTITEYEILFGPSLRSKYIGEPSAEQIVDSSEAAANDSWRPLQALLVVNLQEPFKGHARTHLDGISLPGYTLQLKYTVTPNILLVQHLDRSI